MHDGFGSQVLIYDPYIPDEVKAKYPDYVFTELDTVLSQSDFISLHTSTQETAGIISAEKIALMKPGSIFINTARPQLVDYDALYAALKTGALGGAGLDVFEDEPPKAASGPLRAGKRHRNAPSGRRLQTGRRHRAAIAVDEVYGYLQEAGPQISVQ